MKKTSQYKTKQGEDISFEVLPFNEENKRGWVVHRINAYINNVEAGYINLSYIPLEKWNSIYHNNIWLFRYIALGHFDIPENFLNSTDEEITQNFAERYYPNYKDRIEIAKYEINDKKRKALEEYKMYELYFVDKPIVDFIRTYDQFKRQKVAYALHMYASEWLKKTFGLKLWLSYCRTDNGKCFYDSNLLKLREYRYRTKMVGGYRQKREYIADSLNWYKIASKSFHYLGQCDKLRCNHIGENNWQNMIKNHIKISQEDFINNCFVEELLDDESLDEFIAADPDSYFAKSNWGNKDCYYIMTHEFEFIFI